MEEIPRLKTMSISLESKDSSAGYPISSPVFPSKFYTLAGNSEENVFDMERPYSAPLFRFEYLECKENEITTKTAKLIQVMVHNPRRKTYSKKFIEHSQQDSRPDTRSTSVPICEFEIDHNYKQRRRVLVPNPRRTTHMDNIHSITFKSNSDPEAVSIRHKFFKLNCFPHLEYISKLARNYIAEIEKVTESKVFETALRTDVMIKITFVGEIAKENLRLVTKRKGKEMMSRNKVLWETSPIVCFLTDKNQERELEYMSSIKACHKILVKCNSDSKAKDDKNIIFVDKDHVRQEITSCLEDPIRCLLENWTQMLKSKIPTTQTDRIINEIENVRKLMSFEENSVSSVPKSSNLGYAPIVPEDVKRYLLSHNDVTSFGVWNNSYFKIFVKKSTNVEKIKCELKRVNEGFFEKYRIYFENGKLVKKSTMQQGDCIRRREDEIIFEGTLGGFVKEKNCPGKIYALTCNHVFPENGDIAYADEELRNEIGRCVYTTRDKFSDFAAIEMNEYVDCDVTFRREDEKETNARVYDRDIKNILFVHKIGTKSGTTTGSVISPEYYDKLYDENNAECLFLVGGKNGQAFSQEGDSGAIVFSRPREVEQNYVNVIGMVCGTYQQEDERSDDEQNISFGIDTTEKTNDLNATSQENTSVIYKRDVSPDSDHISCCYRIRPALDLFQEKQNVSVKFRDDLPSSASTSPPSSEDSS